MLLFTLDGTDYRVDDDQLSLQEAIEIQKATGLGVGEYLKGVSAMDPRALKALAWLGRTHAGETVDFRSIDFDVLKFIETLRRDDMEDEGEGPTVREPAPPGSDDGTTPAGAETATSESSPTTSD